MSAPTPAEIGLIPDDASFYNSPSKVSNATETAPKTGEELSPAVENTQGYEALLQDGAFEILTDLDSIQAPYIGEDARVTQLRRIDQMFRRMAGSPTCPNVPPGAIEFLPDMTRGLIQLVSELQVNNGQNERRIAQLQETQGNMETHISWLRGEQENLKDTNWRLKFTIADLRRDLLETERSYRNMKEQKDSLKRQLEAASDSGEGPSKKRGRQE